MANVIDLAKARREALAKKRNSSRGIVRAVANPEGDGITLEHVHSGMDDLILYMDLGEAEQLRDLIDRTISKARYNALKTHGIVKLAWCTTSGRALREDTIRGRIVERSKAGVKVAIEPVLGQQPPDEGWPASGWYWLTSGWPLGRDPKRRGWRIVWGLRDSDAR